MSEGYSLKVEKRATLYIDEDALIDIIRNDLERQGIAIGHPADFTFCADSTTQVKISWTETTEADLP